MAKYLDSPYFIGKRSSDWLKIKVAHTAEFEVIEEPVFLGRVESPPVKPL